MRRPLKNEKQRQAAGAIYVESELGRTALAAISEALERATSLLKQKNGDWLSDLGRNLDLAQDAYALAREQADTVYTLKERYNEEFGEPFNLTEVVQLRQEA